LTATARAIELGRIAAQAAADKLATDITIVDVSERLAVTDLFVLVTAPNERAVKGVVDEVERELREHGEKPMRREGESEGRWVLLDYADIIVHVQRAEERLFYALENLWKDCPSISFVDRDLEAHLAARQAAADRAAEEPEWMAAQVGG
jgi:ribosome-associated protein